MAKKLILIRIKRYGAGGWATCGVGVRPPEHLVGEPSMKRLCPKLVPGQCIELPVGHPLLKQTKLIERVDEPEDDEFVRPWVFNTAEEAAMADPSRSRMGADQIRDGLALADGAIEGRAREHKKLVKEQKASKRKKAPVEPEEYDEPDEDPIYGDDGDEPDFESEDEVATRASNRVKRSVKDEARPVEDDEDEAPAPRKRASRRTNADEPAPRRRRRNRDD